MSDCFLIQHPNAAAAPPASTAQPTDPVGFFRDASACDANDGTPLTAAWLNNLITNLNGLVSQADLEGDVDCDTLLLRTIQTLVLQGLSGNQLQILCQADLINVVIAGFGTQAEIPADGFIVWSYFTDEGSVTVQQSGIVPVVAGDTIETQASSTTSTVTASGTLNGTDIRNAGLQSTNSGCYLLGTNFMPPANAEIGSAAGPDQDGETASIEMKFYEVLTL